MDNCMNSSKERIFALIKEVSPYEDIEENTDLIKTGVLSSLEIFVLIQSIESEFNITISEEKIILENFSSIAAIDDLLKNY